MTDLTEQWKRGEFIICNAGKCQYYYVRNEEQQEVIKTEYCLFDDNTPNWQILAPVPSYEEWQAKLEENAQLKEQINHLLKTQARQFVDNQKLQVKAEKAKDVVNIDTARQIKQLKELLKECKKMLMQSNYQNMTQYHEVLELRDKINKIIGEK